MRVPAGRIVAAALLPPLGVFLARGPGRDFLIDCGLTMLGYLPGVAFALWTVLRPEPLAIVPA
jgi:uncharacterized membrane protein YqaE (UPF0057 family)